MLRYLPQLQPVSVHGGHSGQFCNHARDTLADVVAAYAQQQFAWVGLTEHMPPVSDRFLYPDEIEAGMDAESLYHRFALYMKTGRALQQKYQGEMAIFVAMETEAYSGYEQFVPQLVAEFEPDYLVGSVHHINDIVIDGPASWYREAADSVGGISNLYCHYFDKQYEVIETLRPAVVGHFDLVRMHDPAYDQRLREPAIAQRIERNLNLIRELDLILDYNVRSWLKGATEPYVSAPILRQALEMGIAVVPGDDAHGISEVGRHVDTAMTILQRFGFRTDWRRPA